MTNSILGFVITRNFKARVTRFYRVKKQMWKRGLALRLQCQCIYGRPKMYLRLMYRYNKSVKQFNKLKPFWSKEAQFADIPDKLADAFEPTIINVK